MGTRAILLSTATLWIAFVLAWAQPASAHCDSLGGPVIEDARQALDKGDPTPVLKWVRADQEQQVRQAFEKARSVRTQGQAAREVADTYFFETLVRLHRASEGESFTGLKPAGQVPAVIAQADRCLSTGQVDDLARELAAQVEKAVRERYKAARGAAEHKDHSVQAGREFVAAYVRFIHLVEGLHQAATASSHGHGGDEKHGEKGENQAPAHEH